MNRGRQLGRMLLQAMRRIRIGDWLIIGVSIGLIALCWPMAQTLGQAQKCQIRQGSRIVGIYDLNQTRQIRVQGAIGVSVVQIQSGKVRIMTAPCHHQYCVQQGWLSHPGQIALCLPNQVSVTLLGARGFDSLAY